MKVFITGASGFIGTHLVNYLLEKKWHIRILRHKQRIPREKDCQVIQGDISDFRSLRSALKDTDILFHLAAALGSSLIKKDEFFRINAQGTENILKAAREECVKKIIHFSSAGVLGFVKKNEAATEDYPLNPKDAYDKSKLQGERIAIRSAEHGMNIVIVRPGWVYGPGDRRTFKLIKAIAKKRFILLTKGTTWQTPVYIEDLLKGILLCAEKGTKGEIYHLAGREILAVKEIVEMISSATGEKIPRFSLPLFSVKLAAWSLGKAFYLFKKEAPLNMAKLAFFIHPKPLSIQKASEELGFSPEIDFKKGISLAVSWYRKHGWI